MLGHKKATALAIAVVAVIAAVLCCRHTRQENSEGLGTCK
jgi:hypothetical protein